MLKKTVWTAILITVAAVAQDKPAPLPPGPVLRLEYTFVETDGAKKISSRTYTLTVEGGKQGRMRVGSRVPYIGKDQAPQYMDVGVNLDARTTMVENAVRLYTTFEMSSVNVADGISGTRPPFLRQCNNSVETVVQLDKQVVLTTQDDPSNNTSLQVLLLIKLVK
jgi:hypothetical protein